MGVIPGKDKTKAIVITAHYDGNHYVEHSFTDGALDNASGVSAMMHIAVNLLHLNKKPETDILFVAFDGEEFAMKGSKAFVPLVMERYDTLYNINIDTIGLSGAAYMFNIEHCENDLDIALRKDVVELFSSRGIMYIDVAVEPMSDNITFSDFGIPTAPFSVEFGKFIPIIHTERDVFEVVDIVIVEEFADIITEFIIISKGKMY